MKVKPYREGKGLPMENMTQHQSPDTLAKRSVECGLTGFALAVIALAFAAIAAVPALLLSITAIVLGAMSIFRGNRMEDGRYRFLAVIGIIIGAIPPVFVLFLVVTARASSGST